MAKKKGGSRSVAGALVEIEATNARGVSGLLDDCLTEAVRLSQETQACNGQVFSSNEDLARLIFLPMPALAPRFLLQNDGWPLGRFSLVSGLEESCKSSLTYEIGRWHRLSGGNLVCIETEQKDAAALRHSFFNYDPNAWKKTRAFSQEQWNQAFFHWMERFAAMMDGEERPTAQPDGTNKRVKVPGRGRIAPMCLSVDSISAATLEKWIEQMEEDGSPSQNHPLHAKMLSDFFKVGPKKMVDYPISLVAVSHMKVSQDQRQPHIKTHNVHGGAATRFQMTTHVEMRRIKAGQSCRVHPKYGEMFSIPLEMKVRKNSLGNHEKINVDMCWYFDPDDLDPITGDKRQKTFFDWHSSSIELLHECQTSGEDGHGFYAKKTKALRDLVDLRLDENRRTVVSSALGIGEKDKLSYFEAGQLLERRIQADESFRKELYQLLMIRRQFTFKPGVCFKQQIAENAARLKECEKTGVILSPVDEVSFPGLAAEPAEPFVAEEDLPAPLRMDFSSPSTLINPDDVPPFGTSEAHVNGPTS